MSNSTVAAVSSASPDVQAIVTLLGPQLQQLVAVVQAFRQEPATPERTCAFEKKRPRS